MMQLQRAFAAFWMATFVSLASAQEGPRQEFEARLAEAQRLLGVKNFEQAQKLLLSAIEEHAEQDYVLYHWFEVEDLLTEASFWKGYELPKPADVVSGKLLSWDASSGKIKVRYQRRNGHLDPPRDKSAGGASGEESDDEERAGDFFGSEDVFLHPMLFKGPYEIELEGKELDPGSDLPVVLVAWQWDSLRGLDYGEAYGVGFGEPTAVVKVEAGRGSIVDSSSTLIRYGRPYSFKVRVTQSTISASYNDRLVLKVERPKGELGQFGFTSFEGLDEVVISGEIEPSWIAGLIDERVQRDVREFRERFDPFQELSSWLRKRASGTAKEAREFGQCAPEPGGPNDLMELARLEKVIEEGKLETALELASSLSAPSVGAALEDWVLAHIHAYQGKLDEALAHCRRVCEADPSFYEARLLQASFVSGLGRTEDAARELEELVIAFPEYLDTYERLVLLNLFEGRPEDARKALEVAVDNGIPARTLLRAGRTLLRSENGPSWSESSSYATKHYVVVSNLSREVCFQIASELEEFHQKYVIHVRRPNQKQERKSRVYFFAGLAGYRAYTEDLLGDPAENTLGLYSPWLKQLVIWNSPDKRQVMRTVRHEGFHQYLDQITSDAPVWLNEGMAEYFEQARRVGGRWKDDQTNPDHLAILARSSGDWTPLQDFARLDHSAFRVKSSLHYPQAWALVHFLMNASPKHRKRIDALLDALFGGSGREEALDRAFREVDWTKLEQEFRDYVGSLK